ncbi:MAG: DUF4097 family beta strand repeat-containing protein [Muricomes sp.]
MRGRWRIFWIVCSCLAGLGVVLCIIGAGMGASLSGIDSLYGTKHIVYSTIDWGNDVYNKYDNKNYVQGSADEVTHFTDISELDIDVSYMEVVVKEYDGDSITVDASQIRSKVKKDLVYKSDEGSLTIETKNNSIWKKSGGDGSGYLVIQIPRKNNLEAASFQIGAGRLEIENIKSQGLDISVGAGEAVVQQFETKELNVECGAGEAVLSGTVLGDISVNCGVGKAEITLNGKQEDYNYNLKCGIGELVVGNHSYAGLGNDQEIDNGAQRDADIECGIGQVTVSFTEDM